MTALADTWQGRIDGIETDVHGDHLYTLRQYLLMRRLHRGGEWTDVVKDVGREISEHDEWDIEARATYRDFTAWYNEGAAGSGPTVDREEDDGDDSGEGVRPAL